jgi:hypothetical protein
VPARAFYLALLTLLIPAAALAVTFEATRVVNQKYDFAYTIEPSCEITYQEDGVGLSAKHIPPGADASTEADYGLLVFGSPAMRLTPAEAEAAGLPRKEQRLSAGDIPTQARLDEIFAASMLLKERKAAGKAKVKLPDGKQVNVPFYQWSQKVGNKTGYALMYIVRHSGGFIYVQAEAKQQFSKKQVDWFTGKLELLDAE